MKALVNLFCCCFLLACLGGLASAQAGQALPRAERDTVSVNLDQKSYRYLRGKGLDALAKGLPDYREAMRYFITGLIPARRLPDHDLDSLIASTLENWEGALRKRTRQVELQREQLAEANRSLESMNRTLDRTIRELTVSLALNEAYRLALLSENQRMLGRNEKALFLAHRALVIKSTPPDTSSENTPDRIDERGDIDRVFGNAVTPFAWRGAARPFPIAELAAYSGYGEPGSQIAVNYGGREVVQYRMPNSFEFSLRENELDALNTIVLAGNTPLATAFAPDGHRFLGYGAHSAAFWDLRAPTPQPDWLAISPVTTVAFHPGLNFCLLLSQDSTARWCHPDGRGWKLGGTPYEAHFSPDGQYLLTRSGDRQVEVWEIETGSAPSALLRKITHQNYVYSARFSPDGRSVLTAGADNRVRLTPLTGGEQKAFPHQQQVVKEARFAPQGDRFFSRTLRGNELFVWHLDDTVPDTLRGHGGRILAARWSPDGEQILTTSADGTSLLWDREGRIIMQIPLNNLWAPASIFSSDGQWIIAVYGASELRVYPQPSAVMRWLEHPPNYFGEFPSRQIEEWEREFEIDKITNQR